MRILGTVASSSREVPNAPTIGTATNVGTGRAFNNGAATVTFTAPTFDGGLPITGYTVTSSPGGFTGTGASSPITVTGLQSNTAYTFTVTATNSRGASAASAASNSITATTVPQAPTIGTPTCATGQAFTGSANISIPFTANATGGAAISSFTATSSSTATASAGSSPLTISQTVGSSYTYTVTATNANGTSAASSTSVSVLAASVPQAPTIGTATGGSGSATVAYTANATGGSAVTVFTATSTPGSLTGTGASPITVSGLTNGTAYTFRVTATNAFGTSVVSSASNSVTPAIPALSAWSLVGNYPSTSSYPANASGGGFIWNAGGRTPTVLNTAYRSSDGASWSDLGAMPAARWQCGGAFDGTQFQVMGGYDSANAQVTTTYIWNGSWSTGTALPLGGDGFIGWSQGSGVGVNGNFAGGFNGRVYFRTGTGAWSTGTTLPVTSTATFLDGFSLGAVTNTNDRSVAWALRPKQVQSPDFAASGWSQSTLGGAWSQFGVNATTLKGSRFGGAVAGGFQFGWGGDDGTTNTVRNNGSSWSAQSAFPRAQMQGGSGQIGANIFSWVGEGPQFTYRSDVYRATQN
jgi:hypothetical protein